MGNLCYARAPMDPVPFRMLATSALCLIALRTPAARAESPQPPEIKLTAQDILGPSGQPLDSPKPRALLPEARKAAPVAVPKGAKRVTPAVDQLTAPPEP